MFTITKEEFKTAQKIIEIAVVYGYEEEFMYDMYKLCGGDLEMLEALVEKAEYEFIEKDALKAYIMKVLSAMEEEILYRG